MPIGHEDHGGIAVAAAVLTGTVHKPRSISRSVR